MGSFSSHLKRLVLLFGITLVSIRPVPSAAPLSPEYIWVPLCPNGSSVEVVTGESTNPQILYIGVWEEGIFTSTDGGASWLYSSEGLTDTMVTTLVTSPLSPNILYAGTHTGNVFKSVDGGRHWNIQPGCSRFMDGNPLLEIAIDPANPDILYLRYYVNFLAKSEDGGASCHNIGPDWPNLFTYDLTVDPATSTVLYLGTNQGLLRSTDGGNTWEVFGLEDSVVSALLIAPSFPDVLYAGTSNGVYKSVDHGEHWQEAGLIYYDVRELAIDPNNADIVYAAIYTDPPSDDKPNLFHTRDGGASWAPVSTGWGNPHINSIFISPPYVYVGTEKAGVLKRVKVANAVFLPFISRR